MFEIRDFAMATNKKHKRSLSHGLVSDRIPEAIEGLKTSRIPKVATGIPAIVHSLGYGLSEMGPVRMTRAWLAVNQKQGFDCPSCAWADPDDDRHPFEFCENGAKVFNDTATTQRVTAEFFARYSVAELCEK